MTKIEWTDETWNPIRGCTTVSEGCRNCYAMKMAHRFSGIGQPYEGLTRVTRNGPVWVGKVNLVPEHLEDPLRWTRPRMVFVNSMSDLFHPQMVGEHSDYLVDVFDVMARAERHTFQVLTKRPDAMRDWVHGNLEAIAPNIWLGTSVEDQATADERISLLLETPAAVRWVSAEPLLGPIDFNTCTAWNPQDHSHYLEDIRWVVVGGESGPGARPMDLGWARSIVRQCADARVPCLVKQLGRIPFERVDWLHDQGWEGRDLAEIMAGVKPPPEGWTRVRTENETALYRYHRFQHSKGGDMSEWPEDLRVRSFPDAR